MDVRAYSLSGDPEDGEWRVLQQTADGGVWTGKLDVPTGGVRTPAPDLMKFGAESVEPKPRVAVGK